MITNKNYNVDLARLADKKFSDDFAKEMNFDLKAQGNKSTRDRTRKKILKSPSLMVSASGISNTVILLLVMNYVLNYYYKENTLEAILT